MALMTRRSTFVGQRRHVDGVVEIARGFTVDGDDGKIAEIAAAGEIGFRNFLRRGAGGGENFVGEEVRQMMFANDDFDVHADFAGAAENFGDPPGRGDAAFRKARELDVYDGTVKLGKTQAAIWRGFFSSCDAQFLAQFGRQLLARGNRHFVEDARVVRQHVITLGTVSKQADDRGMFALDDLDDAAFGATVGAAALDACQDAIAVHGVVESIAADEEIAIDFWNRLIGDKKAIAVSVRDDSSGDEIRFVAAL
jgi:hypothetical protein